MSKRLGDLGSTALVAVGVHFGFKVLGFALANVLAALVWIWMCVHLRRRQVALVARAAAVETPPTSMSSAAEPVPALPIVMKASSS